MAIKKEDTTSTTIRQSILNRRVYDKDAFNDTINTDFTELVSSQDPS